MSISPRIRTDWDVFQLLAERGLAAGPDAVDDLTAALALVRGRPFGSRSPGWAATLQREMINKIVDVAHTLAQRQCARPRPDFDAGHRAGIHEAITQLSQVNLRLGVETTPDSEDLIAELLDPARSLECTG